ncbi:MAG: hypothetical protein IT235_02285 [Bacteroidia bacterium]|nr:hypothetical protein [Bacteroidia bacterium]
MSRVISEDLYMLIQSLTMSEKRYFKHFASMGSTKDNKIYERLFNEIERQKVYDEKKILKKIPRIKPSHLSSKKNHLRQLILESLKWFHSDNTSNAKILSHLSEIEILFAKRLFSQCVLLIKKTKNLALYYDKPLLLAEALTWEEKILDITFLGKESIGKLNSTFSANSDAIAFTKTQAHYRKLNNDLLNIYRVSGGLPNKKNIELAELIIHDLQLNSKKEPQSYFERYYFFRAAGLYYYMLNDQENFYLYQKKLVENYESFPQQIIDSPHSYILALNNFMSSCQLIQKEKEFEDTLSKVEKLMKESNFQNNTNALVHFLDCRLSAIAHYMTTGEFEKSTHLSEYVENFILKHQSIVGKGRMLRIYFALAQNYFGVRNYRKTAAWLNKIINDKDTDMRNDLQVFARLLNLIAHFEMGNERLLDYYTKSTYRFLLKKDHTYKIETIIMRFIRKNYSKIISKTEEMQAFSELKAELEKSANDQLERRALAYFDFMSWIESKIERRPFAEIVRNKWLEQSN